MKNVTRYKFTDIFQVNDNETLTLVKRISVNGIIAKTQAILMKDQPLGGVNFCEFVGDDIAGEDAGNYIVIYGFYEKGGTK